MGPDHDRSALDGWRILDGASPPSEAPVWVVDGELDAVLAELGRRLDRLDRRRGDDRARTTRLLGFLGGLLAAALVATIALDGPRLWPWLLAAALMAVAALVLIRCARPRPWVEGPVRPHLAYQEHAFRRELLRGRLAALSLNTEGARRSRGFLLAAEIASALSALALLAGAVEVGFRDGDEATVRVALGPPEHVEGRWALHLLELTGDDRRAALRSIANPADGTPVLHLGAAGAGVTGCPPPRSGGVALRRGEVLQGAALARLVGQEAAPLPLRIAVCAPRGTGEGGARALEIRWRAE